MANVRQLTLYSVKGLKNYFPDEKNGSWGSCSLA
ncbi:hypothetical protein B0G52_103396 [Cohnella sp. SGD-V74]|nr:hypothetical protein B0G52_103396 [Cohnella sp. SGD-V74]